ncbi:hypothetical protein CAI21_14375 [Alkalilimnicola ehrlichii]|uniref:Uncharacterized protein n=1 Tax=Alkalilimnicola ehrlichii TaxID=351052 RepID=A0A3E0WKT2_9GAMM|nr:hypothetical protein [Alkalilimnicola ehrlichii]RFA27792.1 hypothetical protein CAI21_14375 [Alkalilimnicola ehrlichii]RFA33562.1 hypothetical protein CAL65_17050 [Alkalilimnicola ehrlichii]
MGKIIQYQTSVLNTALALRERLRRIPLCVPDEFITPLGPSVVSGISFGYAFARLVDETQTVFVRDSFPPPGPVQPRIEYITGAKRVQLVQPATVSVATLDDLAQGGTDGPSNPQALDVHIVFSLQVRNVDNEVYFTISFTGIEGGPTGLDLAAIEGRLRARLSPSNLQINVGALTELGDTPTIANCGLSATLREHQTMEIADPGNALRVLDAESVLVLRLEIGNYPVSSDAWETFYTDTESVIDLGPSGIETRRWAIIADPYFVTEAAKRTVGARMRRRRNVRVLDEIGAAWKASGPEQGQVMLSFRADAIDACNLGALGSFDIGLDVQVRVELTAIPSTNRDPYDPGALQQFIKVNTWKNDLDTAACTLLITTFWPYVGAHLIDQERSSWGGYVGGFLLPILIPIVALIEMNRGGRIDPPLDTCMRPHSDRDEFLCTRAFTSTALPGGGFPELSRLVARPDAIILSGTTFWQRRLARDYDLRSLDVEPFRLETPHLPCGAASSAGLALAGEHSEAFARLKATITLFFEPHSSTGERFNFISTSRTALITPTMCMPRVRPEDDPLNVFAPYIQLEPPSPFVATVTVEVPLDRIPQEYFDNPYPCRVLIQTSRGTRLITLPAIARPASDTVRSAALGAWAEAVNRCYAKQAQFSPKWIIDPADRIRERHLWEFVVTGLAPREPIAVETLAGRTLIRSFARSSGLARGHILLGREEYEGQLRWRNERPAEGEDTVSTTDAVAALEERRRLAIDVRQTQWLELARLDAPDYLAHAAFRVGTEPRLAVLTTAGVAIFAPSASSNPLQIARASLFGGRGLLAREGEIRVWGDDGIHDLSVNTETGDLIVRDHLPGATDALVEIGEQVFALREGRVEQLGYGFVESEETLPPEFLAANNERLFVGGSNEMRVYAVDGADVSPIGAYRMPGLRGFEGFALDGAGAPLLIRRDQGYALVELGELEEPTLVTEYTDRPYSADAAALGDLLIVPEPDNESLVVLRRGSTAWQ